MLWISFEGRTHQIQSYNIEKPSQEGGEYKLWVTKLDGKGIVIAKGTKEDVVLTKEAIDLAIEKKETLLKIS